MATRQQLAIELNACSQELQLLYQQQYQAIEQKEQARNAAIRDELGSGNSVAAAERLADSNAHPFTILATQATGKIKVAEEKRDNLRFLIKYGLENFV